MNDALDPQTPNKRRSLKAKVASDDPVVARDLSDPGDSTQRNFRYQHAYGVMLLVAAKCGHVPYAAIWCEQHEDFLAERQDSRFDAFQIKTSRPEIGPWTLRHDELVKSIGRFADLAEQFEERIGDLYFVSNKECDTVSSESRDDGKRRLCPKLFLEHVRKCRTPGDIRQPFLQTFEELQARCGCEADRLLSVLRRMDIKLGPARNEFDAVLAHEHLPQIEECKSLSASELDGLKDDLVAVVYRASSLQVNDPIRHLRSLIDGTGMDPAVVAKRLAVERILDFIPPGQRPKVFEFLGPPALVLGGKRSSAVLEAKLVRGGLAEEIENMRERERAAEYNLIEDASRRPSQFPGLLRQVEQHVLGECGEAYLRARQKPEPYGPAMMIDVQDRLRLLAKESAQAVGHHSYECLIGVAGLLTSECRVWWSPRFPIAELVESAPGDES